MKKHFFAQLSLSLLIMSSFATSHVFAADKKSVAEKIEVTPISEDVTKEELAAIYVLSEICPSLIGKDLKFNKAYEKLVKAYLSNEDDAVDVLKKRVKSKDFKAALEEARNDAKAASDNDNLQICDDVRNYYSK